MAPGALMCEAGYFFGQASGQAYYFLMFVAMAIFMTAGLSARKLHPVMKWWYRCLGVVILAFAAKVATMAGISAFVLGNFLLAAAAFAVTFARPAQEWK